MKTICSIAVFAAIACLVLIILAVAPFVATDRGGVQSSFATTIEHFRSLSKADQKRMIEAAFEKRVEHARNLEFSFSMHYKDCRFQAGHVGNVIKDAYNERVHRWVLDKSYRVDTELRWVDRPDLLSISSEHWDAPHGVNRRFTDQPKMRKQVFGRIDSDKGDSTDDEPYNAWLDGENNKFHDMLFPWLLANRDKWLITELPKENLVQITAPWTPSGFKDLIGTRTVILDPTRGFMPVRASADYRRGEQLWRHEQFSVEQSRLVNDVWMPMKLIEVNSASSLAPETANVCEVTVDFIDQGKVTPKSLRIEFPPGSLIVDALKGVSYLIDAKGKPSHIEKILSPPSKPAQKDEVRSEEARELLVQPFSKMASNI